MVINGRHYQRTPKLGQTEAEVLAELQRLRDLSPSTVSYTVSDALDTFLEHGTSIRGWAPATTRTYVSAIELHLRPSLGWRRLTELRVPHVQKVVDDMISAGISPRHASHVRGILRSTLAHAQRQELTDRNVAALAQVPTVRRPEMTALAIPQLVLLFEQLSGERLRTLFVTAGTLGLRRGELIALRWSDVDLDQDELQVRRTGSRIGGEYIEGAPKSERSRRAISVPAVLIEELRRHKAAQNAERLELGQHWRDEDRVFASPDSGPTGATTIRKALNRALERAELPHIRFHDLRHSAATSLLSAGGSLKDLQEMLGHSTYSLTADVYAHVLEDQRKATAERLDRAFGEAIAGR